MILVVGATGSLGGVIVRQLLEKGEAVRILVRPGSNYQPLVDAGAQPVTGDLKDPASLAKACEGIAAVITTANSSLRGGVDNVENVDLNGNHSLIDAAKAAGVNHLIFISALSANADSSTPFIAAKGKTEEYLAQSGLKYTIIAPHIFMGVWMSVVIGLPVQHGSPVSIVGQGDKRHVFVADHDVAAFAVAAIDNPAAVNQRVAVGGPEAVTWLDIVRIAGKVIGQELPVRHITPDEPLPFVPVEAGTFMSRLMANTDAGEVILDMTETAKAFNIRLTTAEEFLRGMLKA